MRLSLLPLFALALLAPRLLAQTPAPAPPPPRPKPVLSPEIADDHHVTFRVKAPQAQAVELRGQWTKDKLALAKNEEGVWSLTTGPVEAGVWEYSVIVDGLTMIDPANPAMKPQRFPSASILLIPGTPPNVWDFQDVPHGAVHQHTYLSKALGRPRDCVIYTPPGYETDPTKTYPLLVLQHGSGDNQQTWVTHGKAHWILDNLIAQGKARPMIILMLDGHPLGAFPREGSDRTKAMQAFRDELFQDAIPLTEARYRVDKDAAHRAIAGLSMGGWQSLTVGLSSLDRFSAIGSFSGGPPEESFLAPVLADATGTNQRLKLLWIAVGKDDLLVRERNEQFIARLKDAKVNYEWRLTEGAHSWPVWRGYLAEFAPKLFVDGPQ